MKEQFKIYTAKNGSKYIQTKNQYLAHALAFCGYKFMVFKENVTNIEIYSFQYSDALFDVMEQLITIKSFQAKNAKTL
jgi:hypothetical protein